MESKKREKYILKLAVISISLALLLLSFNSNLKIWKAGYIEEGQTLSQYNSLELETFSLIENSLKSIYPKAKTPLDQVRLYISEKNQNYLTSNLPYSVKKWVKGLILDDSKLKNISVRHRGDNPNNWLYNKKSWRVKRKKNDLVDGIRVFDYLLPRDSSLINTYLGYFVAEKMNIPIPKFRFVELYINDKYEGLYLELERIDENFLRRNNFMPVNIYKGTPSRTDKPLNQDNDLFNNPYLWEKRAIFNARDPSNFNDLEKLLTLVRDSLNDKNKMNSLEKVATIKRWANFSAYETLIQSWHNYEKNNMYLISDPWMDEIFPIALDTIFNDTKSKIIIDEDISLDNAPHALMEAYMNNSKFMYFKYKLLENYINNGIYEDITKEAQRIFYLIKDSWERDPSHSQFVLTNGFDRKLLFSQGVEEEYKKLLERIKYIEKNIKDSFNLKSKMNWIESKDGIDLVIDSFQPVEEIKICSDSYSKTFDSLTARIDEEYFKSYLKLDDCYYFKVVLNSNRVKFAENKSRITTFMASEGFKIQPTIFKISIPSSLDVEKVLFKPINKNDFLESQEDSNIIGFSNSLNNIPLKHKLEEELKIWQGEIIVDKLLIVDFPLKILPGTKIKISSNGSIIFKNKVQALGTSEEKISFEKLNDEPWGIIALIGEDTNNSIFEYVNFSGGSGGNFNGYEFTGMFSVYAAKNIKFSNTSFSSNHRFDDLIHILYSDDILLKDSIIFDGISDLIDIDISNAEILNCTFKNAGNDAIDAMTSKVLVSNTLINEAGDKGISAGENSIVHVKNLIFVNTEIAIQSKDNTNVYVKDTDFRENNIQLDAYRKNWRYGNGGKIEVDSSSFNDTDNKIYAKNKSKITINNSVFNQSYAHLKTKKVIFKNNTIKNN